MSEQAVAAGSFQVGAEALGIGAAERPHADPEIGAAIAEIGVLDVGLEAAKDARDISPAGPR